MGKFLLVVLAAKKDHENRRLDAEYLPGEELQSTGEEANRVSDIENQSRSTPDQEHRRKFRQVQQQV